MQQYSSSSSDEEHNNVGGVQNQTNVYVDMWSVRIIAGDLLVKGKLLEPPNFVLNNSPFLTRRVVKAVTPRLVQDATGQLYVLEGRFWLAESAFPTGNLPPQFVLDSFAGGFPGNWQEVRRAWVDLVARQEREVSTQRRLEEEPGPEVQGLEYITQDKDEESMGQEKQSNTCQEPPNMKVKLHTVNYRVIRIMDLSPRSAKKALHEKMNDAMTKAASRVGTSRAANKALQNKLGNATTKAAAASRVGMRRSPLSKMEWRQSSARKLIRISQGGKKGNFFTGRQEHVSNSALYEGVQKKRVMLIKENMAAQVVQRRGESSRMVVKKGAEYFVEFAQEQKRQSRSCAVQARERWNYTMEQDD